MMTTDKKLAFLHKMTKLGLDSIPHFDNGGTVLGGASSSGTNQNAVNTATSGPNELGNTLSPAGNFTSNLPQPVANALNPIGGLTNSMTDQFQASGANIQNGTTTGQLNGAYSGAQGALNNQTSLVGQTQAGANQGYETQQNLSGQLAQEAAGQGPNPAQMALNQSTGQNIASQAALAAGTRGASSNAGMIAAQNAQQGAATQQQAVGQAATLQAQQQIAAQQQEAGLASTEVGQNATAVQNQNEQQQNEQNILQGANTSANNANVGMQSNINNVNSQTAAANQNAATNLFGGVMSGASSALASLFADGGEVGGDDSGDDTPAFTATSSDTSSGPSVGGTATLPQAPNLSQSGGGGGGGGGAGLLALAAMAKGGYMQAAQPMAVGGYMAPQPLVVQQPQGPLSFVGQWVNTPSSTSSGPNVGATSSLPTAPSLMQSGSGSQDDDDDDDGDATGVAGKDKMAGGPDASDLGGMATMAAAKGGKVRKPLPMMGQGNARLISKGGKVKADNKSEKAVVNKDSYANDKIPALLSQGEVVMDKDTLNDPGPIGQMARQVAHHIQMRNQKGKKSRV